jgi:Tol biopolymer transport system component
VEASGLSRKKDWPTYGASPRIGPGFGTYRALGAGGDAIWKTGSSGEGPVELSYGIEGRPVSGAAVSNDGRRVAFVVRQSGHSRLWIVNADGRGPQLISDFEILGAPAWSPDGQWIAAGAIKDGEPKLFLFPIHGRGQPKSLVDDYGVDPAWSPSGEFLVYTGADVGTNYNLKAVNANGKPKAIPTIGLTRGARRLAFLNEDELVFLKGNISYRDFWVVDLRSAVQRQLSNLGPTYEVQDFAIADNGRSIIFDRRQEESNIVLIERKVK